MKILKQMLNMFSLVLLSLTVAVMFVLGFIGESLIMLFAKVKGYKMPRQRLNIRLKYDKRLAY